MNFSDLSEVNFVSADPQKILNEAKKITEESLGRKLGEADPILLLLKTFLAIILQQRALVNDLARQNLLTYARNENLNHMGLLVGVDRLPAAAATATVEVKLSAPRSSVVTILQGTRIHAGDNNYFALDSDIIFLSGETSHVAKVTCQSTGETGNGYEIGELNRIVDPQPFLFSIINVSKTEGGTDIEDDDSYRERIRQAPESYSNAGSEGAYIFHTKKVSSLIDDVLVTSENPGEVDIYFLLDGGVLPETEMLTKVKTYLSEKNVRPLTDKVVVRAPHVKTYNIEVRYLIATSERFNESQIVSKVQAAVDDFIIWQRSKIGRDINDTELYWRLRGAGVKRAQVISPSFETVGDNEVAVCDGVFVTYAGLEPD